MTISVRDGRADDSDRILEITLAAFRPAENSFRLPTHRWAAREAPTAHRILELDGRPVASLLITDTWIQVGRRAVLKADIGHVAVCPEHQSQGLGTALMTDTMRALRQRGYHLTRLSGLMRYYARFGYEPFLRRRVEIPVTHMHGGFRRLEPADAYPPPNPGEGVLRPLDEARDWEACAAVRAAFRQGRSGMEPPTPAAPPTNPLPADPSGLCFVYERQDRMLGFLRAADDPFEPHQTEDCYAIHELAYLPGHAPVAGLLVRALLARLAALGPSRVSALLPQDEVLAEALQTAGVSFRRVEMHQAVTGTMIQVLNLPATLRAVAPELTIRHREGPFADWQGSIRLQLPAETCVLKVAGGEVTVEEDGEAAGALVLTQAQFVKALLGINGLQELQVMGDADLDVRARGALHALFARQATGSGPWG